MRPIKPTSAVALVRAGVVLLFAASVWGCASKPAAPGASGAAAGTERSALGNPPFYEVFGRRYHVLDSSEGYVERGTASWYGRDFHRKPTSSGERYDMYAMTAAHKTLPLPTWVEVTNLENGRRVTVRVNDRGPFVGDRLIDMSYAAAEELGMVEAGTARVEVRALGTPPLTASAGAPRPSPPARRAALSANGDSADAGAITAAQRLFIQVGAFSEQDNAAALVERLRRGGFDNAFVVSDLGDALHRVRVGPFEDVTEYDRAHDGLRRTGVGDARLVVGP